MLIVWCYIARCCSVEISFVIKMEQVNFETSMKNIPLGGKKEYAGIQLNLLFF